MSDYIDPEAMAQSVTVRAKRRIVLTKGPKGAGQIQTPVIEPDFEIELPVFDARTDEPIRAVSLSGSAEQLIARGISAEAVQTFADAAKALGVAFGLSLNMPRPEHLVGDELEQGTVLALLPDGDVIVARDGRKEIVSAAEARKK